MVLGPRFPQVLQAACDGLEWAWAELYRDNAPVLLRFLRNQGAADPEDLLGECFIQILRNLPNFTGDEDGFRAWTFTIARHRLADSWRAAGRRPVVLTAEPTDLVPVGRYAAPAADAGVLEKAGLEAILDQLTADQRAVISLRFIDRFSLGETAEILGRSEGSVKLLQHRAVRSLQKLLD